MKPIFKLSPHATPGLLLVVEGLDGTGKSTMIERLRAVLEARGHPTLVTAQPTRMLRENPLFQRFRYEPEERANIDYRALLCLFVADRLQHARETIRPALESGLTVLCHRYAHTTIAEMRASGYDEPWAYDALAHMPLPDASFLVDCPLDTMMSRIRAKSGPEASFVDEPNHLARVQEELRALVPELGLVRLDTGNASEGETFEKLVAALESLVERPRSLLSADVTSRRQ